MLKAAIVGASGYTGAELAIYLQKHPHIELTGLYVSENSLDKGKNLSELHPTLLDVIDLPLQPMGVKDIPALAADLDLVLLATAHEVSHNLAPHFLEQDCKVFDLSGGFRVNSAEFFTKHYGFEHQYPQWLAKAVYGLAEWNAEDIKKADLIAVAGCYPTASLTALKPLVENGLIKAGCKPIINATSGVSGAGRKATNVNSFVEVSMAPYGVFTHRHQPEISSHLGQEVIFTPHLGNFKRGILATINVQLADGVTAEQVNAAYSDAYDKQPIVRLLPKGWPSIKGVEKTPFCDLAWQQQGSDLIVFSAIDNLLKGASAQAMQCVNLRFGFDVTTSLI